MSGLEHTLRFRRTITIELWNVTGTIAIGARRPVELSLCELARDREIDVELVAKELLDRPQLARRLLAVCSGLGLLQESGKKHRLTDAGQAALERGTVFVAEERRWAVAITNDPLLPHQLVMVKRLEERDVVDAPTARLPSWFRTREAAAAKPLIDPAPVRIDALANEGVRVGDARVVVEVIVDDVHADVRFSGDVRGAKVDASVEAPQLRFKGVWAHLVDGAKLRGWDAQAERLLEDFQHLSGDEAQSLSRRLKFTAPAIEGFGAFDSFEHSVPLFPSNVGEAQRWAQHRLLQQLHGHVDNDDALATAFAAAAAPFAPFRLSSPTIEAALPLARGDRSKAPPAAWWWLRAGRDLVGGAA